MNYNEIKKFSINKFWMTGLILILILFNLFYASYFIKDAYPSHNMVSNLIMAAAPIFHLGVPYKDYWDIYSPGIFIFLTPFELFFQGQTLIFKLFHILFAVLMGLIVLKMLIKIFSKFQFPNIPITIFFLLYLLMSNYFYYILFHNAFLALFISLCGLYFLAFTKKSWTKYLISSLLFAFSGTMKETFLFTIFLPYVYIGARYLLRANKSLKLFIKNSVIATIAIFMVFLGNYLYLYLLGILKNYQEISAFKSQQFGANSIINLFNNLDPFNFYNFSISFQDLLNSFFKFSCGLLYIFFLLILICLIIPLKLLKIRGKLKISFNTWKYEQGIGIITIGFLLMNFEGFKLLNNNQPNYSLQMVPGLILAFAFLYKITHESIKKFISKRIPLLNRKIINAILIIIVFCFGWLLYPKWNNYGYYKTMSVQEYFQGFLIKKPEIQLPDKVKKAMGDDNRIFYIYGWGTPYFYYFAHIKPFSRFFILHTNILGEKQFHELIRQFKAELPKVILYTEYGADMNTYEFEKNTFQFKKLLEKCYEFYPAVIYPAFHASGYYLLKSDQYFKTHPEEFIALKYQ